MAGRPPLPVGTWGSITTSRVDGGYRARTRFRDYDGVTRQVERFGRTKGAARDNLTRSLLDRTAPTGDAITPDSRLADVAEAWFAERDDLAHNTIRRYREALDDHILPGVGNLRLREATVSRLDRFIKATATNPGAPTAKLCASVLSGVLGLAVRHDAMRSNPMRDVAAVTVRSKEPRAMTLDEVHRLRAAVARWEAGLPIDGSAPDRSRGGRVPVGGLGDLIDLFLATGARIGEALALRWSDIDLDAGLVTIAGTIVSPDGRPVRQGFTKGRRARTLVLPQFAIDMLMRRRVAITAANADDLVFPSAVGRPRDPSNVRKPLNRILASLDMDWVTPHAFRKTVATAIERDADIRAASGQMGHRSEDVTRRHYVQRPDVGPDVRTVLDQFAPDVSS